MVVRRATLTDARAIAGIHVRSWQAAYRGIVPSAFLESLSIDRRESFWSAALREGRSHVWVAEDGGEVVGWIAVGASRDSDSLPSTAELWAIYVDPPWWQRGVGRRLWDEARSHLERSGYSEVTLWVLRENEPAAAFYAAIGFAVEPGAEKTVEIGGSPLVEMRFRRRLVDDAKGGTKK